MQSSANSHNVECFTTSGRSLIYDRKRMGPRTVPWETPELRGIKGNESHLTLLSESDDLSNQPTNDVHHPTNSTYKIASCGGLYQMP